ncbi:MAG: pyridoxamine 5'-phosphate oxidase family protein [Streptosporangiaceae bacterium]
MTNSNHLDRPVRTRTARLTQVRRKPERASYDREAIYAVIDAAPFSHVATVRDGRPVVLPMAHGRNEDTLFLHGSAAAGLFRDLREGSSVCVTATLFDGLVMGRSARYHSMNYRSVTIHSNAERVTETDEIAAGLRAVVDHLVPGRWNEVREPTVEEILETGLWAVGICDASAKARSGSTIDPEYDRDIPVWAGHIPAALAFGPPIPADGLSADLVVPHYIRTLIGESDA